MINIEMQIALRTIMTIVRMIDKSLLKYTDVRSVTNTELKPITVLIDLGYSLSKTRTMFDKG
jgi:hypothetical protein